MARPTAIIGVLVLLAAVGGAGWLAYDRGGEPEETPLIRADGGPIKVRPEDPGGMAVPDQDKLIYQTLNGGVVDETVERLLPPPEEPLPAPEPPVPEVVVEPPPVPDAQDGSIPSLPPAEIDGQTETPAAVAAPPEPAAPEPVAPPSAEPVAPPPAADEGRYMVQLASFRSIDAADRAWRRAVKKNGDLLNVYTARVVRADLGVDKGVYFRLRVGPFAKRDDAKTMCAKLKARNVDCIVVRP